MRPRFGSPVQGRSAAHASPFRCGGHQERGNGDGGTQDQARTVLFQHGLGADGSGGLTVSADEGCGDCQNQCGAHLGARLYQPGSQPLLGIANAGSRLRISCVAPNFSMRRSANGALPMTSKPAGSRASAIPSGVHPSTDCRYMVTMNWKLR